jgi:paraquat-inducible protein B
MNEKSSATTIGIFTLVGILLSGFAVVILGVGTRFEKNQKILLHFEKSVYGLQVGSDVRLGGVKIGRVSSISVMIDTTKNHKVIPVIVELTAKELKKISEAGSGIIDFTSREGIERAVSLGLRAGMKQESLVTGQLYVEFDIAPDMEGFVYHSSMEETLPVVPTIPTQADELISDISEGLKKINRLDLEGAVAQIQITLEQFSRQADQLDVKRINDNLVDISDNLKELTGDRKLSDALGNLDAALQEMKRISTKLDGEIDPLLEDIQKVVAESEKSLKTIEEAAREIRELADPRSPSLLELRHLVHETEMTSRALQELSNDLKRNPGSLLRGKTNSR